MPRASQAGATAPNVIGAPAERSGDNEIMKTITKTQKAAAILLTVGPFVANEHEVQYFPLEIDERDENGFAKDVRPMLAKVTYGATIEDQLALATKFRDAYNQHAALVAVAEAAKRVSDSHSDGTADVEPDIFGAEMVALENALAALKETEAQS